MLTGMNLRRTAKPTHEVTVSGETREMLYLGSMPDNLGGSYNGTSSVGMESMNLTTGRQPSLGMEFMTFPQRLYKNMVLKLS